MCGGIVVVVVLKRRIRKEGSAKGLLGQFRLNRMKKKYQKRLKRKLHSYKKKEKKIKCQKTFY